MKPVRPLLIALAVLVALSAVIAGVVLLPRVQRWAVLRVAAGQPGLKFQLESVSAGPSTVALRGVQLTQHGVTVKLARLDAKYSLFQLLFYRQLQLDRLVAQGMVIDATRVSRRQAGTGAVAAPAAAPGAIAHIALPFALVVGEVEIAGRALLSGGLDRPAVPVEFRVTGGGLAPGREGMLQLKARVANNVPGASVAALQVQAVLQLRQSLQRTFDRIGVTAVVDADGPQFAGRNQLKLAAELARITSGENYLLQLDTLRGGRTENVLAISAKLPTGQGTFAGEWTLNARTAQLEPFFLGARLPKFDARGSGRFTLSPSTRAFTVQGGLQGEATELEALQPALRAIGPIRLRSEFDIAEEDGVARLTKLAVTLSGEQQPVLELNASGAAALDFRQRRLQLGGAATGEVLRLKLLGLPLAWARPFITGVDVSGGAATGEIVFAVAEGQKLTAQTIAPIKIDGINVVRAGRLLLGKADLALEADAELSAASARFALRRFSLRTAVGDQATATALVSAPAGLKWPVVVTGDFNAELPKLLAPWLPLGPLRSRGAVDLTLEKDRLELRRLSAEASVIGKPGNGEAPSPLVALTLARAFTLDLVTLQTETGTGDVELAQIALGRIPLKAIARPVSGLSVDGALTRGELVLASQGGKLVLRAKSPLALADVTVRHQNKLLLDKVAAQVFPTIELADGSVTRAASGDVALRDSDGATLATLNGELVHAADGGLRGGLTFNFDLPTLASQPLLARADALLAGRASGEIRAALGGGAAQVEARATLNGLVAREGNQALPVANVSLRVMASPDGRLSVQAPILLDRAGQRSDLNFSAEGARTDTGFSFDGRLTSEHIELGDALLLFAAAGTPLVSDGPESAAAQARALSPPSADEKPFWSGLTGQLMLDLKSVTRGKDWTMSGLAGRLTVESERVQLQKLEADFGEKSRLAAKGGFAFAPGPDPYQLAGDFALTEFDAGRLFKALDAARAPTVEGVFSVAGRFEGRGLTLGDTLDRTRGQLKLTSRQGVFRGLKRSTDKLSVASKAVEFGAALGSILKTGRVKEAVEKVAGNAYYVDQLAQALGEFAYDHFSLELVRDASLNVELQNVSLVSPEVRLLGAGRVTYEAGKPWLEQPLSVSLNLASRGKIEQLFGRLRELDGTRDDLGYARSRNPVVIGGTLARPDPTPFFTRVAASKLTDFLTPDN